MINDYYRRSSCRLCDSLQVERVLSLAPTPLANAFVTKEGLKHAQRIYPLDIFFCRGCGHVQLLDVVNPRMLYQHYVYVSGTAPSFVHHFEEYADFVLGRFHPPADGLVIDIGSNDGTLLRFFKERGLRVLGVDPAIEISQATIESGIDVVVDFFTPELARLIRERHGPASVITANNVISHIDKLSEVVQAVKHLLAPEGAFVFEASYLVDVFEKTLFDTMYHEHIDYHSVGPLARFFERHGLELVEAMRIDTHGGSLRGVVQHKGGPYGVSPSVASAAALEDKLGLNRPDTFHSFAAHIDQIKVQLLSLLQELKGQGKRIAGFGAPAKATTLMYHLGFEPGMIEFIVDDSPLKQGLHSPGMHIPILPSQEIYLRKPDYLVILAWNFADPVIAKHAAYRELGGRFIIPLPQVKVV